MRSHPKLAGFSSVLWTVDSDEGEKRRTPLLWLRRLRICNFKSCLQFYIRVSLPRCLSYLTLLAGAVVSKLGGFLLHLEGSCRGKKGGGWWRGECG